LLQGRCQQEPSYTGLCCARPTAIGAKAQNVDEPVPQAVPLWSDMQGRVARAFDAGWSLRQPAPFGARARVADSSDLLARALAILNEEVKLWQARRTADAWSGPILTESKADRKFKVARKAKAQSESPGDPAHIVSVRATVNGAVLSLSLDPRSSLLDVLREQLALTGTKKGCDHGQCGACTVHLDGRSVVSCLTLAVQADGRRVTTIEGLSPPGGALHPMQQAFIDYDALQCGYCTPGQIMAAVTCVSEGHATSPEQIRKYMSSNICRCGAYVGIVAAIQDAASKMHGA